VFHESTLRKVSDAENVRAFPRWFERYLFADVAPAR
jgi:hypothetical protein